MTDCPSVSHLAVLSSVNHQSWVMKKKINVREMTLSWKWKYHPRWEWLREDKIVMKDFQEVWKTNQVVKKVLTKKVKWKGKGTKWMPGRRALVPARRGDHCWQSLWWEGIRRLEGVRGSHWSDYEFSGHYTGLTDWGRRSLPDLIIKVNTLRESDVRLKWGLICLTAHLRCL